MAKVSNIQILKEKGADNSYFATWEFNEEKKSATSASTSIRAGSIVKITGSKYYNGVNIPDSVKSRSGFKVKSVSGDRAILGGSTDGQYKDINSPVNTRDLQLVSGGSTSGGTTTTDYTKYIDHYEVEWHYHTGQKNKDGTNIWFGGGSSDVTIKQSDFYSPPENAGHIRVRVKPVSKTYTVKSGDTEVEKSYWTGENVYQWFNMANALPEVPDSPETDQTALSLTVKIEGIEDPRTDKIQFQLYNTINKKTTNVDVTVKMQKAEYKFTLATGYTYYVRCRAINDTGSSKIYSDWSPYVYDIKTPPAGVSKFNVRAYDEEQVVAEWSAVVDAEEYEIQHTHNKDYFYISNNVLSVTVSADGTGGDPPTTTLIQVDTGKTHFFRIRARNDQGESGWSDIVTATVGSKPEKPTTWSLTNSALVGEDITLYWVHNAEDDSKMEAAKISLVVDGVTQPDITITGITNDDEEDPIQSYTFNTSTYDADKDGAKITWKVRTKGAIAEYSDWSISRDIDIFAPPTADISANLTTVEEPITDEDGNTATIIRDELQTYPLSLEITTGPERQRPITYNISVTNQNSYESVDHTGSDIIVPSGTSIYSKTITSSNRNLELDLTAGDLHLENGQWYTVTVTVAMDSGLTATGHIEFLTNFDVYEYEPDASIGIDYDTLTAFISPYCMDEDENLAADVTLSVYRREFNGLFTTIATDIPNTGIETIIDPHPALDYARYRIVATNSTSGAISYEDLPGHPVNIHDIVIQWDEQWSNFDYTEDAAAETPPWTGSMLRFPYNIDVSESYSPDVSLVKYAGREHPVSYFGTHRGESATWNTVIPADDKETIYALRRLASYMGNVYVREPSGTGYWAQVKVAFPMKHLEVTIAVTFTITRVEGGI